ncbi:MAG: hypothetical protein JNM98_15625 [Rhodocyclaceae bacterium]|nr:hypothetical protein [Rhodocyclaceae bacterium]
MPATDTAASWLHAYHTGADLPGGLAFRAALDQADLDYSPDSLARIDRLLRQIRRELAPEPRIFMEKTGQRNFVLLLAFYLGTLIARHTLQRIDWYHHDELADVLPADEVRKLPHSMTTSLACTFRRDGELSAFFLPLRPLAGILFRGTETPDLAAAAESFLRRALAAAVLVAPEPQAESPQQPADYAADALQRLGRLAGIQFAHALLAWQAEGRPADPQLCFETSAGRRDQRRVSSRLDADPVETCRARMAHPEPDWVGAVASHAGHVNLARFRSSAVMLEAHWFAPHLAVSVAVPCRPAADRDAVMLHSPRVLQPAMQEGQAKIFAQAFFAGIEGVKPGLWARHFVAETDPAELAWRQQEQVAAAQGTACDPCAALDLGALDIARCMSELPADQYAYAEVDAPAAERAPQFAPLFGALPALLAGGRVVWGHLVLTSRLMFHPGAESHPGFVVYDPAGRLLPAALQVVARRLLALRRTASAVHAEAAPDALAAAITEQLQNELSCAAGLAVPQGISRSGLLLSSIWLERKHLPAERLSARFFPILVSDATPGRVMLLPARWWPEPVLAHWMAAERVARGDDWEHTRAALAAPRSDAHSRALAEALEAIEQYVAHGMTDARIAQLCAQGSAGFTNAVDPPPRAWEWEMDAHLQAAAEVYLGDVARARAHGDALPAERARLVYVCAHMAQMIALYRLLLREPRGFAAPAFALDPAAILYVALGFAAGCDAPARQLARMLCTLWQRDDAYRAAPDAQARAAFILLARHCNVTIALPAPAEAAPALEALLEGDLWRDADGVRVAAALEAACSEHTEIAPPGPFQCLPVALLLMLKLRALAGLKHLQITHPLLAPPLGSWGAGVELAAALDPLLTSLRARLQAQGCDENAIAKAVLEGAPLGLTPTLSPEQQAKMAQAELLMAQFSNAAETRRDSALRGRRMLIIGACAIWGMLLLWVFFQLR